MNACVEIHHNVIKFVGEEAPPEKEKNKCEQAPYISSTYKVYVILAAFYGAKQCELFY